MRFLNVPEKLLAIRFVVLHIDQERLHIRCAALDLNADICNLPFGY